MSTLETQIANKSTNAGSIGEKAKTATNSSTANATTANKPINPSKFAKLKLRYGSELLRLTETIRDKAEAGFPIIQSLMDLEKIAKGNLKLVLQVLANEMQNGKTLGESMKLFPKIFDPTYCALVSAGEEAGRLTKKPTPDGIRPGTLDLLISHIKRTERAKSKIKSALVYPAIIGGFVIVALLIFAFFILPSLKEVFIALNLDKNFGTMSRLFFALGDFIQAYWYTVPIGLGFAALGVWQFWKVQGKQLWHHYQFKLPVVKSLLTKYVVAETFSLMSIVLSSGLTSYNALSILQDTTKNKEVAKAFDLTSEYLRQGKTLAESLKQAHYIFDDDTYQILDSAEKTGKLDDILSNNATRLYEQIDNEIETLIGLIEPACLAIAGVVVGYLVISYYGTISSALANIK
ncbi:MAG: type II secretion system F family protein [Blastocatellia bacterium]